MGINFFWNVQASQAVRKLSEVLGEILSSHHDLLLNSLMKELPGRLWEVGIFLCLWYSINHMKSVKHGFIKQ